MIYRIKTALLLGLLTGLLLFLGKTLGGNTGIVIAFIIAIAMNFSSYWFSDKIVLTIYRARKIEEHELPWLYSMVKELSSKAGIPAPPVYLVPMEQPNAFAAGRGPGHSVIGVTSGILNILTREELKGVIAHEIAHIKNRDVLIASIAATIAGAISMIAHFVQWMLFLGFGHSDEEGGNPLSFIGTLILVILTPIIAMFIQLAISRSREYIADETGAKISRNPLALARALEKISIAVEKVPAEVNEGTAHLFIENPLKGGILELLSTHPPVEKRIEKLRKLAKEMNFLNI